MIILEPVYERGAYIIGLVAATDKDKVGYSLFNVAKEKKRWDLGLATKIAVGRAEKGRTYPMESLFDLSERFRVIMKEFEGTEDERYYIARHGYRRTFIMTKAVEKMILKAKKTRW